MRTRRWGLGIIGLAMALLAAWQIGSATQGLAEIRAVSGSVPVTIIGPAGAMDGTRPLLLIGQGLAGSDRIMRGFAYTAAHAGYVAALWDFRGHGANPNPMSSDSQDGGLIADAEAALAEVRRLGMANASRVVILGHSMGSGVALTFGQANPETFATIAV